MTQEQHAERLESQALATDDAAKARLWWGEARDAWIEIANKAKARADACRSSALRLRNPFGADDAMKF